jgi:release factor glutamine methyltransferase
MPSAAPVSSVRDALSAAEDALRAAGCETPRLDAELLLASALGISREALFLDAGGGVPAPAARRAMELVRRRVAREPVAYILGVKGFRHIDLAVDSRVLIPRPETELLVEVALELPAGARVHEVGTGSGAVALALLDERPDLQVTASDASPAAVEVAGANARRLGRQLDLTVARGLPDRSVELSSGADLFDGDACWDFVLANMPYVREDEWEGLEPEIVKYEPREALVAGADGLAAIRELVADAPAGLRLALEHAPAQASAVRGLLQEAETRRDLAGLERVTVGRAP